MIVDEPFGYLKANTVLFAQKMCQSLNDMCGADFSICKESLTEGVFSTPYRVILFANFSGAIQGNYIISLDDRVGANLIHSGNNSVFSYDKNDGRIEYCGLLKEVLNIAVGQAIEELGKSFLNLAYSPVTAVFGEIEFPPVMCASVAIEGREGKILCSFTINLANLKIGKKLEETLCELERQADKAEEFERAIDSLLSFLKVGFLVVDEKGVILPGLSRIASLSIELPSEAESTVDNLPDLIGVPENMHSAWDKWLKGYFATNGILNSDEQQRCKTSIEISNVYGRILKFTAKPLADDLEKNPRRLLIVIESID